MFQWLDGSQHLERFMVLCGAMAFVSHFLFLFRTLVGQKGAAHGGEPVVFGCFGGFYKKSSEVL